MLMAGGPCTFNTATQFTFCWILRSAYLLKSLSFSIAEFWCPCTSKSLSASTKQPLSLIQWPTLNPIVTYQWKTQRRFFCQNCHFVNLWVCPCAFSTQNQKKYRRNSENCHFYLVNCHGCHNSFFVANSEIVLLTSKIQFLHPGYQITSFVYPQFKIWPSYRPAKHLSSKSALLEQS